ncbi:hypothetical protein GCM10009856_49130 [Mycolicibacterium llatzerense]
MAAPSTFTPGLLRPVAAVGNGLLKAAGRTGHMIEFFGRVVLAMPTMWVRYRKEFLRLLSDTRGVTARSWSAAAR